MKLFTAFILLTLSFNSFSYSVVDSMYESKLADNSYRLPASGVDQFCLMTDQNKLFANSCYSDVDLCQKRLNFWKNLPGVKKHTCVKIQK